MNIPMTEYLEIDLEHDLWLCRRCGHKVGNARRSYKEGLLAYVRDPREIHKPILDPEIYQFTFAPDPNWCRIIEYYCPECGTMMETEYLPIGHPPQHDMEFDIDALKTQWHGRQPLTEDELVGPEPVGIPHQPAKHKHHHGGR